MDLLFIPCYAETYPRMIGPLHHERVFASLSLGYRLFPILGGRFPVIFEHLRKVARVLIPYHRRYLVYLHIRIQQYTLGLLDPAFR